MEAVTDDEEGKDTLKENVLAPYLSTGMNVARDVYISFLVSFSKTTIHGLFETCYLSITLTCLSCNSSIY